jgi:hypothetical protein
MDMAGRQGASLHEAAPALAQRAAAAVDAAAVAVDAAVAAVVDMAAVVTGNRCILLLLTVRQISKWRETVCGHQS